MGSFCQTGKPQQRKQSDYLKKENNNIEDQTPPPEINHKPKGIRYEGVVYQLSNEDVFHQFQSYSIGIDKISDYSVLGVESAQLAMQLINTKQTTNIIIQNSLKRSQLNRVSNYSIQEDKALGNNIWTQINKITILTIELLHQKDFKEQYSDAFITLDQSVLQYQEAMERYKSTLANTTFSKNQNDNRFGSSVDVSAVHK